VHDDSEGAFLLLFGYLLPFSSLCSTFLFFFSCIVVRPGEAVVLTSDYVIIPKSKLRGSSVSIKALRRYRCGTTGMQLLTVVVPFLSPVAINKETGFWCPSVFS
jgi:hypothetical protein